MTWSYSGNPSSSAVDAIRFLIGDTDSTDPLLSNEEITWINYEQSGSGTSTDDLYYSAHYACHAVGAKLSRLADKQVGDLSVKLSQKADAYRNLALDLWAHANRQAAPIAYAGGISISDKEIDETNTDRFSPWFKAGQFADYRDGGRTNNQNGIEYFGQGRDS